MQREYPERPWVGVGVVVWYPEDSRVLLVQRGKPPKIGQWGLPGGAQKLGETVFQTAIREVLEETNLTIQPLSILTAVDAISPNPQGQIQYHYTIVEVLADYKSGIPMPRDDVIATKWSKWEEVSYLVEWEVTRDVIRLAANVKNCVNFSVKI